MEFHQNESGGYCHGRDFCVADILTARCHDLVHLCHPLQFPGVWPDTNKDNQSFCRQWIHQNRCALLYHVCYLLSDCFML